MNWVRVNEDLIRTGKGLVVNILPTHLKKYINNIYLLTFQYLYRNEISMKQHNKLINKKTIIDCKKKKRNILLRNKHTHTDIIYIYIEFGCGLGCPSSTQLQFGLIKSKQAKPILIKPSQCIIGLDQLGLGSTRLHP